MPKGTVRRKGGLRDQVTFLFSAWLKEKKELVCEYFA